MSTGTAPHPFLHPPFHPRPPPHIDSSLEYRHFGRRFWRLSTPFDVDKALFVEDHSEKVDLFVVVVINSDSDNDKGVIVIVTHGADDIFSSLSAISSTLSRRPLFLRSGTAG